MTFFAITSAYGVQLGLEYDRRAFGDPVAGQVLDLFVAAMTALVQTPEQTGQAVVASVLRPSVQTGAPVADLTPLFDRIHHAALRTPQAAAVVCGEQSLDWAGLMIRAQRIAAALREHGVQRGDRVAIALPRGASFIAAILACMGTGAAYVPIDVTYPQDRIGQVLAAAQPKLVLGKDEGLRIDESGINAVPWADLPRLDLVPPDPGGVAYVMFTSGSTGAPLGVPITHALLSHSTNARAQAYDAAPTRFALLSSLGFDSSVAGLFWTLAEGGTLVLPDVATLRDPVALTRVLHDGISHVLLVPTLYNALLDHTQGDDWPSCVIVAGEACSPALVRRHFTRFPQTTLSNEYGPTEGTVWALSHRISPDDRPVPLGQPVAGCWAAVVDRAGQVLAQGASGELVIGGPLITSGYVGGRGTQATRFLTGGTGDLPAGPAFRTGDRALVGQGHRITLETDVNFIATPRSEQRDWLLHQRLRDLSQDLEHLNSQAPAMVAATGALQIEGRDQATLDPDEIMEDWQIPLMRRMADLVAGPGGDILEIGFGRGILSDFVQAHPVNSHAIVECNPHVIDDYHHWAARHPQADLRLFEGLWQDVSDQFAQYDGILFHTYPLDQDELVETLAQNATFAQTFFATAARALRPGGRFTYFTNEADSLSRAHQRALLDHFDGFTVSRLARLNIFDDTADAHWFNSIVVVVATRAT